MQIRKSEIKDIKEMLPLYQEARKFMVENGNPTQWDESYPGENLLKEDIKAGSSYVCVEDEKIIGTFMLSIGEDKTYLKIYDGKWLNEDLYGVIHRITTSINARKGVASFCVDWCFTQIKNIRIDTHRNNIPMRKFLEKKGFKECGIIYVENGDERIAYQKCLNVKK